VILFLTVLLKRVSVNLNYDTAFLSDCTKFSSIFTLLNRKFNENSKNVLKQSFSHSKWVLQVILSLTTFQTVFMSVQTLTPLFPLTVPNFVVFFTLLNRKFNEDFKNVLKTTIFSLQVGFTGVFVLYHPFKLCF